MDYHTYTQKLNHIKWLATRKMTGSPQVLANKLGVSRRTVERMLMRLRDMGENIHYCRRTGSYVLKN